MKVRFSIRDILLTTLIVGLALGWYLDRRQLDQRYQANTASLITVKQINTSGNGVPFRAKMNAYMSKHNSQSPPTDKDDVADLFHDYRDVLILMTKYIVQGQLTLERIEVK